MSIVKALLDQEERAAAEKKMRQDRFVSHHDVRKMIMTSGNIEAKVTEMSETSIVIEIVEAPDYVGRLLSIRFADLSWRMSKKFHSAIDIGEVLSIGYIQNSVNKHNGIIVIEGISKGL
jgi:hypothetical protein